MKFELLRTRRQGLTFSSASLYIISRIAVILAVVSQQHYNLASRMPCYEINELSENFVYDNLRIQFNPVYTQKINYQCHNAITSFLFGDASSSCPNMSSSTTRLRFETLHVC